ncbi:MAG: hypothetical protein IKE21_08040 [Erysipelotrichaceae bacterium]|nr:hypothetical protein [Erysipelotrichaceae bacterium]
MKKNVKLAAGIAVLLIAVLAGGVLLLRPSIHFTQQHPVLERTESYRALDYVGRANGTVAPETEMLDTEEVGEQSFHYKVKKWIFERDIVFTYTVEDTIPPQIALLREVLFCDPGVALSEEEIRANAEINEGTLTVETDYEAEFSGTYPVKVRAEDDSGNVSEASFNIVVRDTEAPVVFRSGNGAVFQVGEEFDANAIMSYGDNADPRPVLELSGKVDTSEPGEYSLYAVLTDASGNVTDWELNVTVTDEEPEPSEPDDSYYAFEEFRADHGGPGRKLGIDISNWQGDIDFRAAKAAGCEFVIIRVGYSFQGELTVDKRFHQNLDGAKAAGLPVGIYLFCYDNNEEDLRKSLEQVYQELGDTALELPVVFDWENFGNYQEYEVSFQQLNHLYDVFAKDAESRGYQAMLYGSKYYLQSVWNHTDTRPVWLAQYASRPTYNGPYEIWQVSEKGKLDGVPERVDLDILYTD